MNTKRRTYYDAEPWYRREHCGDWYQQMIAPNSAMKAMLEKYLSPGQRVLEVACGGGWLGEFMVGYPIQDYVGFDYSETAVANAASRLASSENARVVRSDALEGAIYDSGFDLLVAHQFLHCLIGRDRLTWLQLCRNSLVSSCGLLILSSMIGVPEALRLEIDPTTRINRPGNRFYAEDQEIREELEQSRFMILETRIPDPNVVIHVCQSR